MVLQAVVQKSAAQKTGVVALLLSLLACSGGSENQPTPPSVPTTAVAINVSSAWIIPSYSLDGGDFPEDEYNDGNFVLRSTTDNTDTALLGSSHDASPAAVRVVLGGYDVLYQHETGSGVPQNFNTPVQSGETINADRNLSIALTSWMVTPAFTHSPGAFPASEHDDGVFYLRPLAGGEAILLGNSHTAIPGPVSVLDGSYDVMYVLQSGGSAVPNNQAAVLTGTHNITANGPLSVAASSVSFQFDASLDGVAFPVSPDQQAEFFLRNSTTGDRVELGLSNELPVTVLVLEGTYDIVYRHREGDALPINTDAVIASNVLIDAANPAQNINIGSVEVVPTFSLNGADFPQDEYSHANFYLRNSQNHADEMFLAASDVLPNAVRVIRSDFDTDIDTPVLAFGSYDVLYRHETGDAVPQNTNAVIDGASNQAFVTDGPLAVAITSVEVGGAFTLNGNPFPSDANNNVRFLLRDSNNDSDEFLFGFSDISNEPVMIVSGTYHVVMDHQQGEDVPQNKMHEVDFNVQLNADQTLSVDVPVVRVDPGFTLDGQAFSNSFYQSATFYLREIHAPFNRIFLGYSYKNNQPVMVIEEDYDVVYEHLYGNQVPQNTNSTITRIDL